MSVGLEQIPANQPDNEYQSAPSSADFYIPRLEAPDYNDWVFSDDFPRDRNGLVDLSAYQEYLPDHPDTIPPIIQEGRNIGLVHQHIYFWRRFYRQKKTPPSVRDGLLKNFWLAPYNQLVMRFEEEAKIHNKYKKLVSPPPIETMRSSVIDFGYLDRLGAAAIGRRVALVPEAFDLAFGGFQSHKTFQDRSPLEIARLFDGEIERILKHLETPLVTDQRVVTGAISRMARLTNNKMLLEEKRKRTENDPTYYPVRIKDPKSLLKISRRMLDKKRLVIVRPVEEAA